MKKNIFISVLISLSSYVAYIGSNGQLHNIFEIMQGFGVFVVGQSLVLILLAYLLEKKNISAYLMFIPMIVIMFCRRLWTLDWYWLNDIGMISYDYELRIISIVLLGLISLKLALKFKHKLMNIAMIFVFVGMAVYSIKAYKKVTEVYNAYIAVSTQQFKDDIDKKIEFQRQQDSFVNRLNVYHILIDSYPNKQRIKEMIGYDITPFYQQLSNRGFKVYETAYSNGSHTEATVKEMLNMRYNTGDFHQYSFYGINKVFLTMLSQGYKVFCYYPCYTGLGNIGKWNDNLIFPTDNQNFPMWKFFLNYYLGKVVLFYNNSDISFRYFNEGVDKISNDSNYYFYIHEKNVAISHHKNNMENIKLIKRKNNLIINLIDKIITKDKNSIIILHSDHGSRKEWNIYKNWDSAEATFSIIQAVKFPPQCDRFNNIPMLAPMGYYEYIFACLRGEKQPVNLQSYESYKNGKLNDFWNDAGDPNSYIYIRNNKILTPPEISNK